MIGLTPESLWRAANSQGSEFIAVDDYKNFLRNSKLGLSQGQATRIAYMADEECCGQISYEKWLQLLQIYEIS